MGTISHRHHGGNLTELAALTGLPAEKILDFSANINPFGPPPWLAEALEEGSRAITQYPDPDATRARLAAAERFQTSMESFVFADGADSLLFALPRALGVKACLTMLPTYSGYKRGVLRAGVSELVLNLDPGENFSLASEKTLFAVIQALKDMTDRNQRCAVFIGAPNNPAGGIMPRESILSLASSFAQHYFIIDESFIEFLPNPEALTLIGRRSPNIITVRSMTKTFAVPGARLGFMHADPKICAAVRAELPAWPVSSFAEAIAVRALRDTGFLPAARELLRTEADWFISQLAESGAFRIFHGDSAGNSASRNGANFLLLDFFQDEFGLKVSSSLLDRGIAVRQFSTEEGLSKRYMRIAIKNRIDNSRFLDALAAVMQENQP